MSGMVTFTFLVGINDPENCIVDIEVQNSRADPLWSTRGHSGTPLPHSTFLMQQSSPVSEADTTYDFDLNLLQSCIERHRGAVKLEIGVVQSSRGIFREQGSSVLCGQDSWETLAGQGHESQLGPAATSGLCVARKHYGQMVGKLSPGTRWSMFNHLPLLSWVTYLCWALSSLGWCISQNSLE